MVDGVSNHPTALLQLPTLSSDPTQLPLLSRLWNRQRENLEKSLTCSCCGDNTRSWWHCPDVRCWLSLCARCYSQALSPYSRTQCCTQRH